MAEETRESDATPLRRRRQLETIADVRRHLAVMLKKLAKGHVDPQQAKALIYGYKTLAELIRESNLEERIARLEEARPSVQ